MSPTKKSTIKGTGDDVDLDEAKFLWDEYRYRHDLCWRLIFQITTAVVAILIVPYIQPTITKSVGLWIVALPFLAFILVLFSMSRMMRELEILGKVRTAHRARQSKIHHITWTNGSHFTRDVMLYLLGLMIVCIAAGFSLIYIWRPA
jgi:Mn2+/Fe2+ NRAMP family transporter